MVAIYARENGQGMAFPMLARSSASILPEVAAPTDTKTAVLTRVTNKSVDDIPKPPHPKSGGGKPSLTRIK